MAVNFQAKKLVSTLGWALRWMHLATSIALVGSAVMLLLAGPSDRPTVGAWQRGVARAARWLLVLALLTGLGVLIHQRALLEGRGSAALEPTALARVATQTQAGLVWLVRLGILIVAGFFAMGPVRVVTPVDWLAVHGEIVGLALVALGLLSAAGHAAAAEPNPLRAIGVDFVHLAASGLWAGALPALALLLRRASREDGADARPYAVIAAQRFSGWALVTVLVLVASGIANAVTHVRDVGGLLGTTYGRLLLVKLAVFALALVFAALNRRRFLPALGGDARTVGRPAMKRLAGAVTAEAVLMIVVTVFGMLGRW
jgi:putative copper resistance protein D